MAAFERDKYVHFGQIEEATAQLSESLRRFGRGWPEAGFHRAPNETAQVAVVTGASAGIGRATARLLARRGTYLGLLARGQAGLEAAATEVRAAGGEALAIPTDVSDFAAVERAASQVEEQFGPIDAWINVTLTSLFAPFTAIEADRYRRVTEVSYLGYVHGTMASLNRMRPRDSGVIVQVASAPGGRGTPQSADCGVGHAINGFTESVRSELLHERSHVHVTLCLLPAVAPACPLEVAAEGVVHALDHPRRKQYRVDSGSACAQDWVTRHARALISGATLASAIATARWGRNRRRQ